MCNVPLVTFRSFSSNYIVSIAIATFKLQPCMLNHWLHFSAVELKVHGQELFQHNNYVHIFSGHYISD